MGSVADNPPLIVVVGQTAAGKSALALELARRFGGEIIAADSRTVYKGMDIGTAKPTRTEQAEVPHHLIDIAQPDEAFTVADFQRVARKAIIDIAARDRLPILAGGTGLYVDSILFDFTFRGAPDPIRRRELEQRSVEELQVMLQKEGLPLPANERNPRHLIRAIEAGAKGVATRALLRANTLVMGVMVDPETLAARIAQRIDSMLDAGLENEVRSLTEQYGWERPPLQTIGYQEFRPYFEGTQTIQEVRQAILLHTRQYAVRQRTWFKRNTDIHWISKTEEAVGFATTFLNK